MRYSLLLLFILLLNTAFTQNKVKLDENSVVKDSMGTVYPFAIWRALLVQGDYGVKPEPGNSTGAFVLYRLSDTAKQERLSKMPKPRESDYFTNGRSINLFSTSDITGKKLNLKAAKGKIIVLNFWFINCAPCRDEIPALNRLVQDYASNPDVIFVALAPDSKYELTKFLEAMPFNYQVVNDARYIIERYGIRSFPTHVVIDPSGKVYFHTTGLASNTVHWLKKSIEELLPQLPKVAAQ